MKHNMKLNAEPFEAIRNGSKTIELRLNDEKRQLIKIDDEIVFTQIGDNERTIHCKVMDLFCFKSFAELYDSLPLTKCGYTDETVLQATPEDMNKYYSKEQQEKYGVLGIEIELM